MSHFLSTRFTVEKNNGAGTSTEFYDHIRLLLYYAYGNYKTLAKKITLDNSMLLYLNNTTNNKNSRGVLFTSVADELIFLERQC